MESEFYFYPDDLKKLPIKNASEHQIQSIIQLVGKILSLNEHINQIEEKKMDEIKKIQDEIKKTDEQIDELVYDIYGIEQSERKLVEDTFRNENHQE